MYIDDSSMSYSDMISSDDKANMCNGSLIFDDNNNDSVSDVNL